MTPMNDIERLLFRKDFGPQHHPEVIHLVRDAELVFLIPFHPEMEGEMSLGHGDLLPPVVIWRRPGGAGRCIPIFTSIKRAQEGCKTTRALPKQYTFCEMVGWQLFGMMRHREEGLALNPGTKLPSLYFNPFSVRAIAEGTTAHKSEETGSGTVVMVEPDEYPTDFLQPIFSFFRERPEMEAAWLFRQPDPPSGRTTYVFVLKVRGDSAALESDFRIVATGSCPMDTDYGVCVLDGQNLPLEEITSNSTPFYAAVAS